MTRVQILFNPASGRCSPRLVMRLATALRVRGATVIITETGHGPPLIGDVDHVCVVGGDGTLRHVAHALAAVARPPRLSVFAGGTVNLIAREWPGGACVHRFAARVIAGEGRGHFPVILGEGAMFLACAGAGWESAAVASVDPLLKRRIGRFAYLAAAARLLRRWSPPVFTLNADGAVLTCGGFHVVKGRHYAGRWRLGSRDWGVEPLMEVVALTRARRRDLLRFWWTLARGRSVAGLSYVRIVACAELVASSDRPWPLQADGDVVGTLPSTLRVSSVAIDMR